VLSVICYFLNFNFSFHTSFVNFNLMISSDKTPPLNEIFELLVLCIPFSSNKTCFLLGKNVQKPCNHYIPYRIYKRYGIAFEFSRNWWSCVAGLNQTKFGTFSSAFITLCDLIPPLLFPLIAFLPTHFNMSLNRLIVVLSTILIFFLMLSEFDCPIKQSLSKLL
jgi:hypothetical protein